MLRSNRIRILSNDEKLLRDFRAVVNFTSLDDDPNCVVSYSLDFIIFGTTNYRGSGERILGSIQVCRKAAVVLWVKSDLNNHLLSQYRSATEQCISELERADE